MSHQMHTDSDHIHVHGPGCGHTAVHHEDHVDYLHDGHLHHHHNDHYDEHTIPIGAANPEDCTAGHECQGHDTGHEHGPTAATRPFPTVITSITW